MMLHAHELLNHLTGLRLGHPLYVFDRVGSTNSEARQLAEGGAPEGLLVVAEEQTAGRGRHGRVWYTPPYSALAFSLVLRPALPVALLGQLTMLAGVAVCDALYQVAHVRADLKWPNDVLISGRKLGGILLETALRDDTLDYAVLGIGLNVSWSPAPGEVDFPATHLLAESGRSIHRAELLRAILVQLENHYATLQTDELWVNWQTRLTLMNVPIRVETASGPVAGHAVGVTPEGALLLRDDHQYTHTIHAGNVHLRPQS